MQSSNCFRAGDRILVHGNMSRHQDRMAEILAVGNSQLSVRFEDGLGGTYIDYKIRGLLYRTTTHVSFVETIRGWREMRRSFHFTSLAVAQTLQ
jgi:hypothetical protein